MGRADPGFADSIYPQPFGSVEMDTVRLAAERDALAAQVEELRAQLLLRPEAPVPSLRSGAPPSSAAGGERIRLSLVRQERLAAVGQLAAGLAHDFNNTLAAVSGGAEYLLGDSNLTDEQREVLVDVLQASRRGAVLIRQILDFGRKTIRNLERIDLAAFMLEQASLLRRTLPESISVLEEGHTRGTIYGDVAQLQQITTNLAINSRDALNGHPGTFRLRLREVEMRGEVHCEACGRPVFGSFAELAVEDSGPGIPAEARPHIFEPYFTTKAIGLGTGLGLSQVLGIVQQHDAHITVGESELGGAAFRIFLHLEQVQPSLRPPTPEAQVLRGDGQSILLVEDDPNVMRAHRRMLEALGYHALVTDRAVKALELLHAGKTRVDLIISDVVMPDMSGDELVHALLRDGLDTSVVLVSGYPLAEGAADLLEQGRVAWLQKPVAIAELSVAVASALSKQAAV